MAKMAKPKGSNAADGDLYVISAPSGAGKTSLVAALQSSEPGLQVSVSHTTRPRRGNETDGVDYHFVSEKDFVAMIDADAFLEHARVFDRRYGTARDSVQKYLTEGDDVILEIDWQGASQVRERHPDCIGIFILPPSRESLAERLTRRAQDPDEVITRRMRDAIAEMSHYREFDYLVINDDFEEALGDLRSIIRGQRLRQERQIAHHPDLIASLLV
jgi:guanylate kinase